MDPDHVIRVEPRGHFVPRPSEPTGHFVPVGDPTVRSWARAASEHAETYVRDQVEPQIDDLRRFARAQLPGDRLFEAASGDLEQLRTLVRAVPHDLAEQISRARSEAEVEIEPVLTEQLTRLQNTYPWMAPRLVRLRHSLSKQALEDNVAIPAGRQIGLG